MLRRDSEPHFHTANYIGAPLPESARVRLASDGERQIGKEKGPFGSRTAQV